MDDHLEIMTPLLTGLSPGEQDDILAVMRRVQGEQIDRKRNPVRRRRRGADGELRMPGDAA